jgi:hypothetical protein
MACEAGYKPHEADHHTIADIQIAIEADFNKALHDLRNTRIIAHTILCANWQAKSKPPSAEKFMPLPGDKKFRSRRANPTEMIREFEKKKKLAQYAKGGASAVPPKAP